MKGTLISLAEYYDKYQKNGESKYKFIGRKTEEGVFKVKERAMYNHFTNGTGFVFVKSKTHLFLMEGIVRV